MSAAICKGCGDKIVGKDIPIITVAKGTITSFGDHYEHTQKWEDMKHIYHERCYNG